MNKVILIGRLTRDPDINYTQGNEGMTVARYTLAVDRRYKANEDQSADFISCVAFRNNAEFAEKYLKNGMKIAVVGHIQTGSYTNRKGQKVFAVSVVVEQQEFCETKAAYQEQQRYTETNSGIDGFTNIPDGIDDLPFN